MRSNRLINFLIMTRQYLISSALSFDMQRMHKGSMLIEQLDHLNFKTLLLGNAFWINYALSETIKYLHSISSIFFKPIEIINSIFIKINEKKVKTGFSF